MSGIRPCICINYTKSHIFVVSTNQFMVKYKSPDNPKKDLDPLICNGSVFIRHFQPLTCSCLIWKNSISFCSCGSSSKMSGATYISLIICCNILMYSAGNKGKITTTWSQLHVICHCEPRMLLIEMREIVKHIIWSHFHVLIIKPPIIQSRMTLVSQYLSIITLKRTCNANTFLITSSNLEENIIFHIDPDHVTGITDSLLP